MTALKFQCFFQGGKLNPLDLCSGVAGGASYNPFSGAEINFHTSCEEEDGETTGKGRVIHALLQERNFVKNQSKG